jgi:hypothetical protein
LRDYWFAPKPQDPTSPRSNLLCNAHSSEDPRQVHIAAQDPQEENVEMESPYDQYLLRDNLKFPNNTAKAKKYHTFARQLL